MLKLSWLGSPTAEIDGAKIHFETRKVSALLAYLSLNPKGNARVKLAALLWPESIPTHSMANLRRALGSLIHSLPAGYVVANYETIGWNETAPVQIDVQTFQSSILAVREHDHTAVSSCPSCLTTLEAAVNLYQGDFLDGLNLPDSPDFDDWQYFLREEQKRGLAWILEQLVKAWSVQAAWEKAVRAAKRWVALDRLEAKAQLALVEIYTRSGQRSLAQRQFGEYLRISKEELGQEPDDETVKLFQHFLSKAQSGRSDVKAVEQSTPQSSPTLLKTKLYLPTFKNRWISRLRLLSRLEEVSHHKLTLISAPAGFGKTSLLADWIKHTKILVGWLSLDSGDNDPIRFLTYICAAFDNLIEGASTNAQDMLESQQPVDPQSIIAILLNDLEKIPDPLVLVLDDYQFITNHPIHEACNYLLERATQNLHLVIASRADPPLPLARLRTQGELLEIRADDLRFTLLESETFFNQVMKLDISPGDVQALAERTEGWAVGLQLAAISLRGATDRDHFIRTFSGSHRYILDYLMQEVLDHQPDFVRDFLLKTSILERLNAALCEAILENEKVEDFTIDRSSVTFQHSSLLTVQQILEYLERENLFLVPLDDERNWFRYHHLFADLLRSRLDQIYPGGSRKLHARAAAWLEQEGNTVEAINHLLAAGDYDRAARLVEDNTTRLLAQGELNALMSWIEVLPAALRLARPRLCIHQAYVLTLGGRGMEVPPLLAQAEATLGKAAAQDAVKRAGEEADTNYPLVRETESIIPGEGQALAGAIAAIRAMAAAITSQDAEAISQAQLARELLPAGNLWDRAAAAWALGYALQSQGHLPEARAAFEEQVHLSRAMSTIATLMIGLVDLAWAMRDEGKIRQARALLEEALAEASQKGARTLGFIARTEATLVSMLYEQNDLIAAHSRLSDAINLARFWPNPNHLPFTYALQARVLLAEGDLLGARRAINEADRIRRSAPLSRIVQRMVEVDLVRVWLAFHQSDTAFESGDQLADQAGEIMAAWRDELAILTETLDDAAETAALTLARAALARGRAEEALMMLEHLTGRARTAGHTNIEICCLVLTVMALQAVPALPGKASSPARRADRAVSALANLNVALELAEPGGYVRVFLDEGPPMQRLLKQWLIHADAGSLRDYAIHLLSYFDAENNPITPTQEKVSLAGDLVEPLSQRELEVLHLIAVGKTNKEIAQVLFISRGTVKAHSASIYRKLDVSNRTGAVARARQLGLLT